METNKKSRQLALLREILLGELPPGLYPIDQYYAGALHGRIVVLLAVPGQQPRTLRSEPRTSVAVGVDPELGPVIRIDWDAKLAELFLLFFEDLLLTQDFERDPVVVIERKLRVWEGLIASPESTEQISRLIGLWGEMALVVRRPILAPTWGGPAGSDWDFEFESRNLELKTTLKKSLDSISISSLHQLAMPLGSGAIAVGRLERALEGGSSICELRNRLPWGELKLATRTGCDAIIDSLSPCLQELPFVLKTIRFFPVDENFPRLVPTLLEEWLGPSIAGRFKRVNYEVGLDGLLYESEDVFFGTESI